MIRINGKSWKTTSLGIIGILGVIVGVYFKIKSPDGLTEEAIMGYGAALVSAIGLLFAKDGDVTTEPYTSEVKKVEQPKPSDGQ